MVIGGVITLNGSAQNVATALGYDTENPTAGYPIGWMSIQADTANANLAYLGTASASLSTLYTVRIEIPTATVPDAPFIMEGVKGYGLNLNSLWVLGTNAQKLRVMIFTA